MLSTIGVIICYGVGILLILAGVFGQYKKITKPVKVEIDQLSLSVLSDEEKSQLEKVTVLLEKIATVFEKFGKLGDNVQFVILGIICLYIATLF